MGDFHVQAYQLQADHYLRDPEVAGEQGERLLESWLDESTVDYWRQNRMYDAVGLLAGTGEARWLTVGDGRYGIDSRELRKRGVKNVLPTDISEHPLRKAKERGLISAYSVENAERLSFRDGEFDYVLCKEAYHHFPRPFIALYEMLRVAKEAVVIIEPNDYLMSPVGFLAFALKRLMGKARHIDDHRYETSGNYVYSISEREIEKACLGLDLPQVFFKGLNDVYVRGSEYVPARLGSPIFLRTRLTIAALDLLCRLGLFKPTRLMACIFKREPPPALRRKFLREGWKVVELPRNPYRAQSPQGHS